MENLEKTFNNIFNNISRFDLQKKEEESELFDLEESLVNRERRNTDLFLGYYSPYGVEYAFKKYGIFETLNNIGFKNLSLKIDHLDFSRHKLSLYFEQIDSEHLLTEIILKREYKDIDLFEFHKHYEFLFVEWLYSQNPKISFSESKARLLGQKYPGLHTGKIILELLIMTSKRLKLSGIINIPQYFHNAQIYSKKFSIYDPFIEGKRKAIERDLLSKYSLAKVSWSIEENKVYENGKLFNWKPTLQIVPLRSSLYKYFDSDKYKKVVKYSMSNFSYEIRE